jgi:hypothetical protein
MPKPKVGATYRHRADTGLAARARVADPDVSDDLPAEMVDLDMHPDTTVKVCGYDDDRDLVLVEWTDLSGTPRITSIEPDDFDQHFVSGKG